MQNERGLDYLIFSAHQPGHSLEGETESINSQISLAVYGARHVSFYCLKSVAKNVQLNETVPEKN